MNINGYTKICLIIGDPVEHSLSPAMHNACYESLGIDADFVYLAARVKIEEVEVAVKAARTLGIRGLTCTMPHKIEVMKYLDKIDPVAKAIGAVNTVVNENGVLTGYNTDWSGVLRPLQNKLGDLKGKKMVLLGAGGAARAAAYVAKSQGMELRILNRTLSSAAKLAAEFGGSAFGLEADEAYEDADIIVNSTSVGMGDLAGVSLVPIQYLNESTVVFESIYKPNETLLVKDAKMVGAKVIQGYEMLLYQGLEQFKLYTNKEAPEKVMRDLLERNLGILK